MVTRRLLKTIRIPQPRKAGDPSNAAGFRLDRTMTIGIVLLAVIALTVIVVAVVATTQP